MSAEIPLTRGLVALVDDADFDHLASFRWHAIERPPVAYAARHDSRRNGRRTILMHRLLLPGASVVDHVNGNGLDNRRANLRSATPALNAGNGRMRTNNSSGYKGVSWYAPRSKWLSRIGVDRKTKYLGYYVNPIDAALAYDAAAREAFGEFAALNFPRPGERAA